MGAGAAGPAGIRRSEGVRAPDRRARPVYDEIAQVLLEAADRLMEQDAREKITATAGSSP